jgi:hypothetical protein
VLTFPTHLFCPIRTVLRPGSSVVTGGESLIGEVDTLRTDGGGYWLLDFLGIELMGPDKIRAWRAWQDELAEGVTRVLVPVNDIRYAPRPIIGGRPARPSQLHDESDDPYFPEAVGFATPYIVANVTEAAALRATALTVEIERGARLKGGEVLALEHAEEGRRCYRVGRVLARDGQSATVNIRPPLREAIDADMAADFDWPSMVATLVPGQDISPAIENDHATVSISFREAF